MEHGYTGSFVSLILEKKKSQHLGGKQEDKLQVKRKVRCGLEGFVWTEGDPCFHGSPLTFDAEVLRG